MSGSDFNHFVQAAQIEKLATRVSELEKKLAEACAQHEKDRARFIKAIRHLESNGGQGHAN
jgi:hypothetical protein